MIRFEYKNVHRIYGQLNATFVWFSVKKAASKLSTTHFFFEIAKWCARPCFWRNYVFLWWCTNRGDFHVVHQMETMQSSEEFQAMLKRLLVGSAHLPNCAVLLADFSHQHDQHCIVPVDLQWKDENVDKIMLFSQMTHKSQSEQNLLGFYWQKKKTIGRCVCAADKWEVTKHMELWRKIKKQFFFSLATKTQKNERTKNTDKYKEQNSNYKPLSWKS